MEQIRSFQIWSSAMTEQKELLKLIQPGDTLIVCSLDRLGRTIKQLITLIVDLGRQGINFVSLKENIDTEKPEGKAFSQFSNVFSEMEIIIISERTKSSLKKARQQGRIGGRRPVDEQRVKEAVDFYMTNEYSPSEICELCKI